MPATFRRTAISQILLRSILERGNYYLSAVGRNVTGYLLRHLQYWCKTELQQLILPTFTITV